MLSILIPSIACFALLITVVSGAVELRKRSSNYGKGSSNDRYRVEVGQSRDSGRPVQHMISARITTEGGRAIHYERVDMRKDGWEEQLAINVAVMKQKLRALEAAQRIALET